jgi:Tol biopolymer transport system component
VLVIAAILGFLQFRDGEPGPSDAIAAPGTTGGDVPAGHLVFAADSRLQTIGPEGDAEPLANRSGDHGLDWSSDGTRLAVARLGDIVVLDAAGRPIGRPLTTNRYDNAPSWSPDGSRIVFDRPLPDGRSHLWIVDLQGDEQPFPRDDEKTGGQPDWSPDGKIVFQRLGSLYVTPVGGGDEALLELGVAGTPRDPAWSPTRSEIAFALTGDETGIYVYSFGQAGAARRVAKVTKPRYPAWSSDGERLVFTTVHGIWTVNRDGTGLSPVYRTSGQTLETPSWRPK